MGAPAAHLTPSPSPSGEPQALASQLPPGKLIELSGTKGCASTTVAGSIVLHAQRQGETSAWVQHQGGTLFPPDLSQQGVDLNALAVIHIPKPRGFHGLIQAAEILLRSGAFGLVIADLRQTSNPMRANAWQGRLLNLARLHQSRVVLLSNNVADQSSLGPLIGVRIEPVRQRSSQGFTIEYRVLKNKSGLSFHFSQEQLHGSPGLH